MMGCARSVMDLFKNAMYDGFIVTEDLIIDEEVTDLKETSENKFHSIR